MDKIKLAKWLHDNYEEVAKKRIGTHKKTAR